MALFLRKSTVNENSPQAVCEESGGPSAQTDFRHLGGGEGGRTEIEQFALPLHCKGGSGYGIILGWCKSKDRFEATT